MPALPALIPPVLLKPLLLETGTFAWVRVVVGASLHQEQTEPALPAATERLRSADEREDGGWGRRLPPSTLGVFSRHRHLGCRRW